MQNDNFEITKNDLYHSIDFDCFCYAHVTPDAGSVWRVDYNVSKRKPFHTFLSAILFLAAIVKLVYGELGETRSGQNQRSVLYTLRPKDCPIVVDCRLYVFLLSCSRNLEFVNDALSTFCKTYYNDSKEIMSLKESVYIDTEFCWFS